MNRILLLVSLLWCGANAASAQTTDAMPAYVYCEIICDHLPTYKGDGVLFDFGQPTKALSYNWLKNDADQKLVFNSSIEALNYMVRRGWEFVQAYTSGEKNQNTHLLLRIVTSRLTEEQQQMLNTPPALKSGKTVD